MLAGATAVSAVGWAGGCGSPGNPADPTGPTDSAGRSQPGAGSAGTPLGAAAEVPVGGGKVFEALEVVVTQPAAGRFLGFSAVCTHTGCIVTSVTDGTINCPCHGSRFRLDGTVAVGPASRPLRSRPVTVTGGEVVLD